MDAVLRRGVTASLPRSPREIVGSTIAALRRRLARPRRPAERPPAPPRDLPPEWFRYLPF